MNSSDKMKSIRMKTGLSQAKFSKLTTIPVANIQKWEQGISSPPDYLMFLLSAYVDSTLSKSDTI